MSSVAISPLLSSGSTFCLSQPSRHSVPTISTPSRPHPLDRVYAHERRFPSFRFVGFFVGFFVVFGSLIKKAFQF